MSARDELARLLSGDEVEREYDTDAILANPQTVIAALVEAGALRESDSGYMRKTVYELVAEPPR